MIPRSAAVFVAVTAISMMLMGCDNSPAPIQQIPGAIPQVPGQLQVPTVPGQPAAVPTVPGQPAAVPAVPGQPAAVPTVPGQPAAAVPATPAAPAVPGQPAAAAPVAAAPVAPAPAAAPETPATPPTPTGDELTDTMNTLQFEKAKETKPTSMLEKVELKKGKTQSYDVQLPGPPFCHWFAAVGDEKVKEIELKLESPAEIEEAKYERPDDQDKDDNSALIANHCPTVPGMYKLHATVAKGKGEIAVQVFSK